MKKQIDVALVIKDINMGLGDVPIMEKYGLTPSEYVRVLEKLIDLWPFAKLSESSSCFWRSPQERRP
jgi:hypothetical protein